MSPVKITASVGAGCINKKSDVEAIQTALNKIPWHWGGPIHDLATEGDCGPLTKSAIGKMQQTQFGWQDSKISSGGVTLARLNEMLSSTEKPGLPNAIRIRWNMSTHFVGQVMDMACWAATGAMLISARDNKQYTLEEGLVKADNGRPDGTFHYLYKTNSGLPWSQYENYIKRMGLKGEGHQSFHIGAIKGWLAKGPIGVTLQFQKYLHIVAVNAMQGDGTEFGTLGRGYDPYGYEFGRAWRTIRGQYEMIDAPVIWHI
jgi:hypothetical protein